MNNSIKVINLKKYYGTKEAVKNISFEIQENQINPRKSKRQILSSEGQNFEKQTQNIGQFLLNNNEPVHQTTGKFHERKRSMQNTRC